MSFTRFAAVTVAGSILCCGAADAGGPLRVFKHGLWSGGAYTDDRTGVFSHCSAGVAYDTGINLFVLVTADYRWWLGFINPEWSFKPKAKLPVRLRLDDGETSLDRQAIIPNGQLMLIPLPDSSRLVDGLRHSSQLALEAEGQSFFFKLNEIPAVMDRLTNCVRTSLELKDKAPTAGSLKGQEEHGSTKAGSALAVTQSAASGVAGSPSTARSPSPNSSTKTAASVPPPQSAATPAPDTASVTELPPASVKAETASADASAQSAKIPAAVDAFLPGAPAPAEAVASAPPRNPQPPSHPVPRALPSHRRRRQKQRLRQPQRARNQRWFRTVNWPRRDRDRPMPLHPPREQQPRRIRWMRSPPRLWRRHLRHHPPLPLIPQQQNRPHHRCPPQWQA